MVVSTIAAALPVNINMTALANSVSLPLKHPLISITPNITKTAIKNFIALNVN
jgi:hypothetical protein